MRKVFHGAACAFALTFAMSANSQAGDATMENEKILHTIETMTSTFSRGEIENIMSTYESGAVVMAAPGKPVTGSDALKSMFADFIAAGVEFVYGDHEVVVAGDIGLHLMKWTAGDQTALSVAVLRRQADGSWKMVIDHPFGNAVMGK